MADFPKLREGPRSRVGPQLQSAVEVLESLSQADIKCQDERLLGKETQSTHRWWGDSVRIREAFEGWDLGDWTRYPAPAKLELFVESRIHLLEEPTEVRAECEKIGISGHSEVF